MLEAKLTNDIIIECPYCERENDVQFSDLGDEFECQLMHCEKYFQLPSFKDYVKKINLLTFEYGG